MTVTATGTDLRSAVRWGIPVPCADGTALITDLYPAAQDSAVLCIRTPYGRSQHTAEALAWQQAGFSVVIQDIRGRHDSAGALGDSRSERADAGALLDWLSDAAGLSGPVVPYGTGIEAALAWVTALARPAATAAVISVSPDLHLGPRVLREGSAVLVEATLWRSALTAGRVSRLGQLDTLLGDAPELLTTSAAQTLPGWPVDIGDDGRPVLDHAEIAQVRAPSLHVTSWYDPNLVLSQDLWERASKAAPASLLVGFWVSPWTTRLAPGCELDFAGHEQTPPAAHAADWLADVLASGELPYRSRTFRLGALSWSDADHPPAGRTRRFAAGLDGLSTQSPATSGSCLIHGRAEDPFPSGYAELDQSWTFSRDDVLTVRSPPLREALTVAGAPTIRAYLSGPDGPGQVVARILDEHPDGRAYVLGCAAAHADICADAPAVITFTLNPIEIELAVGHRIVVQLSTAAAPRYASHRSDDGAPPDPDRVRTVRVHLGETTATELELPVLDPGPSR